MSEAEKPFLTPTQKTLGFYFLCLIVVCCTVSGTRDFPVDERIQEFFCACIAFGIGGACGASELWKYEKHSQDSIFNSDDGRKYVAVNGFVSVVMYLAMVHFPTYFPEKVDRNLFFQAVAAGTGSMAILRTRLLRIGSLLDGWLELIDARIRGAVGAQNQSAFYAALPRISTQAEYDQAIAEIKEALVNLPDLGEEKLKILDAAIAKSNGSQSEAFIPRISLVLRAYGGITTMEQAVDLAKKINVILTNRRAQLAPPDAAPAKTVHFQSVQMFVTPNIRTEAEFNLVMDIFAKACNGAGHLPPEVGQKILKEIETVRKNNDVLFNDRLRTIVQIFLNGAGVARLAEVTEEVRQKLVEIRRDP